MLNISFSIELSWLNDMVVAIQVTPFKYKGRSIGYGFFQCFRILLMPVDSLLWSVSITYHLLICFLVCKWCSFTVIVKC